MRSYYKRIRILVSAYPSHLACSPLNLRPLKLQFARRLTKWGFREVLEKKAAAILQPDLCHAGGITEVRLIAGMAEAYYAAIAPHNPLGPISLAAGVQLAASIPNFLC